MKETISAGVKEFFLALCIFFVIYIFGSYISFILPCNKIIGDIITVIMLGIYTYFVMTRYAAVYTYSLEGYTLNISRRLGKFRFKEITLKTSQIKSISYQKPEQKPLYRMKKTILPKKEDCYITFNVNSQKGAVLFSPSSKLRGEIDLLIKNKNTSDMED